MIKPKKTLIAISQLPNHYLIEDDYNGEFRYLATPTPALYSFGNSEQITLSGFFFPYHASFFTDKLSCTASATSAYV
jgi:hypothetical protein